MRQLFLGIWVVLFAGHGAAGQPRFEIVSIKPNQSGSGNGGLGPRGSRLVGTNVTLRTLVMYAYSAESGHFLDSQILGEPDWAREDHFDIEAKPPGNARVAPGEETRAMVRALLEDSFRLKAHREMRDLPVYNLVAMKNGPKAAKDQTPVKPRQAIISVTTPGAPAGPPARGTLRMAIGPTTVDLTGTGISVIQMLTMLQSKSDRLIVDRTGFTGLLDVEISFGQDLAGPSSDAPSLFTAMRDIGLRLEPGKAPVEVLVIDHAEHPPEN